MMIYLASIISPIDYLLPQPVTNRLTAHFSGDDDNARNRYILLINGSTKL